jgi:hypothetical protein
VAGPGHTLLGVERRVRLLSLVRAIVVGCSGIWVVVCLSYV